jgi:boron transporter
VWSCSLLPAIAFALDMFQQTDNNFGVNEVLLSSVLAAVSFSLFAGQPLCIVGVTGFDFPSLLTQPHTMFIPPIHRPPN